MPDGFEFLLAEHIKQRRPSYKVPPVVLKSFPAYSLLCVDTYLREYLKPTKPLRGSETKLLISCIKPYKLVSKETVSRWIPSVMEAAGIDNKAFRPHSTRAEGTLKGKALCVAIHDILHHAGWSSSRCFDLFFTINQWNHPILHQPSLRLIRTYSREIRAKQYVAVNMFVSASVLEALHGHLLQMKNVKESFNFIYRRRSLTEL